MWWWGAIRWCSLTAQPVDAVTISRHCSRNPCCYSWCPVGAGGLLWRWHFALSLILKLKFEMGQSAYVDSWGGLRFGALVLRVYYFNRAVSVSTSQRQMGLLMQWCRYVRPATAAAPVCLYCSTERERESKSAVRVCLHVSVWVIIYVPTHNVLLCVCVYRNTVGQMGIDVVNQEELTCCPGFDELFSLFNPSPSIPHMLGNSQYRL